MIEGEWVHGCLIASKASVLIDVCPIPALLPLRLSRVSSLVPFCSSCAIRIPLILFAMAHHFRLIVNLKQSSVMNLAQLLPPVQLFMQT